MKTVKRVRFSDKIEPDRAHTDAAALAVLSGQFSVAAAVAMTIGQLAMQGFHASAYSSERDNFDQVKHLHGKRGVLRQSTAKERVIHWKRHLKARSRSSKDLGELSDSDSVSDGDDLVDNVAELSARPE